MTTMITAVLGPQSKLSDLYSCAIGAMARYNRWLINQSMLGEPEADGALRAAKENAMDWFGSMLPECLAISDAVASHDGPITASLEALGHLATQLRDIPDRSRYFDSVVSLVLDLVRPVEAIAGRAASLSAALDLANARINQDRRRFGEEEGRASIRVRESAEKIMRLNGALHAEQHACCPNRTRLAELAGAMGSEERVRNTSGHIRDFMTTAIEHAQEGATGSLYLGKFWTGIVNQTRLATVALRDFRRNPEILLQTDFNAALERWHALVVEFKSISEKTI
jgi:hypothetical protein